MLGFASKTTATCLAVVVVVSSMAGLVCADGPDEMAAMECCKGAAHHCNMPEKTEDCCKPDRSSQNPASIESTFRATVDMHGTQDIAFLAPAVTQLDAGYRVIPFFSPRGSPVVLVNRPLDIPLLH